LWGRSDQLPVIALHGWLDNSASFDVLAPLLAGTQCLALDLSGHGFSDHKNGLADYPLWSEIMAVYAIADQMGWSRFALMGHSRGAMMSLLTSGVYPERVSHLICIDALLPPVVDAECAPERMIASFSELQRRIDRKMSLYASYDDALQARCQSRFAPIGSRAASILASRGLREVEGRFHWHADNKLWAPSNVALSASMVRAFIDKISAPSLLLLGEQGLIKKIEPSSDSYRENQKVVKQLAMQVHIFDDGHFLHMETSVNSVADTINAFLL